MKMLFFLLALLAIIGCLAPSSEVWKYSSIPRRVGERKVLFYVDTRFNDSELVEIQESIVEWDHALNGNLEMKYGGRHSMEDWVLAEEAAGRAVLVNKVDETCPFIPNVSGVVLAFASGRSVFIISGRVGVTSLRGVMLHEIGHILGLGHFGNTLMKAQYDYGMYYCITQEVISSVASIWGFEGMNYCARMK